MARTLLDIGALDSRVLEEVAAHGDIKDFKVTLWQQAPDASGCNWNGHIERIQGNHSNDTGWWIVLPQMRERFNVG